MRAAGAPAVRTAPGLMGKLAEVIQHQQGVPATGTKQPPPPEDPSAEELEAMLEELLEAYREPAFQAELAAVRTQCFAAGSSMLMAMGPVVLKVQAPILRKYGQPPNFQGVDNMKHAVQRRVAEGSERLARLANEARRLLGLELMPDRSATAEQVLAERLEETNQRFSDARLQQVCRGQVAADRESGALPAAAAAHLVDLIDAGGATPPAVLALLKMGRHGIHARMLQGLDLPTEIPTLEAPSSEEFFQSHVLPNYPAVLRGALDAERFPPLRDFPDLNVLRRLCGHRRVLVKSLGYEDRQGRPVFVTDPELKLPLAAFLDSIVEYERGSGRMPFYLGKVPLKKELPELAQEISNAPSCPQRIYGKCFGSLIPEGVFTYFGNENLLLCLSGTKRLWLFPPSEARHLYPCNDFSRSAAVPFADWEDLSEELRGKFPLLQRARHFEVRLGAGDMLYLPSCWWHCVEGSEEPNLILNWWFGLHDEKKELARSAS